MTLPALCAADLHQIVADDEPRILDVRLAERLEFKAVRQIRELIGRNARELERYGRLSYRTTNPGSEGGRPAEECWLNEAQAILLCMKAKTLRAADARQEIIAVFMAWRHGRLQPKDAAPVVMTRGAVEQILASVGTVNVTANLALATSQRAEEKADKALRLVIINKNPAPKSRIDNVKLWQTAGKKASNTKAKHKARYGVSLDEYGWDVEALRIDLIAKFNAGIDRWGRRILSIDDLELDQMNPSGGYDYRANFEWVHKVSNHSKQDKSPAEYSQSQKTDQLDLF